MRKILIGTLWCLVIFLGLNLLLSIIFYFFSSQDYQSFDEGFNAGVEIGSSFYDRGGRLFMIIISVAIGGFLTYKEILPFTKSIKISQESENPK